MRQGSIAKILLSGAAACLLGSCSLVGIRSGTEERAFTTIEHLSSDVEIRRYGPGLAAETTVHDQEDGVARGTAFRTLAAYIFGANRADGRIAMTAPVAIDPSGEDMHRTIAMTAPVTTARDTSGVLVMRFFMPSDLGRNDIPEPNDPAVRIVEVPEQTLAVLTFSGRRDDEAVQDRGKILATALADSRWLAEGAAVGFFYDPPWTLPWFRRNEVAVAVSLRPSSPENQR
ncbi:heme-binding protein [Telmatospirillum sp.]|uniref:SOUL family heme-binding protein n=1 Tax=Telmatospirillum sp. TaxID=2079197 RepID=UPI002848A2EF|nr:heme-binding protein [Telmatospirillum sp.]MDR3438681.1 heme-binding protein [Telmatospirillum sp.]